MGDRRPVDVHRLAFGVRSDKIIEVARFELVGVASKRHEIRQTKMTRTESEEVAGRERLERRVAPGAAARNDDLVWIGQPAIDQIASGVDCVLDIDDAPGAM